VNDTVFASFGSSLAPILILIGVGAIARSMILTEQKTWEALDHINFKLLIPTLIIGTLSETDIYAISGFRIMFMIVSVLVCLTLVLAYLHYLLVPKKLDPPEFSSVFQTSTRWNASIAIATAGLFFDAKAIAVIAIIMVALMPLVNIINISMMVRVVGKAEVSLTTTLKTIALNPIIIGCLIGIVVSASKTNLPSPIERSFDILAQACIGTILISLGSALSQGGLRNKLNPILLGCFLKLLVMPALVLIIGYLVNLDAQYLTIATVATAMPTATNGYIVAQEMGGDAPLYATIATTQTLLSFLTVPLWYFLCLSLL